MADARRIEQASRRFRAFFDELGHTFLEREEVLEQVALALLCKEHALLTGPPGTAKSQLANAVFGRIVCEDSGSPSVYTRQITEATVQTDLIGPIDFKNLMETGRTSHFTDEGMLGATHAFLDEVFDGRDMLLRSALNVLQERELKEGTKITRGRIEVALMTSNRYIADVLEHARETLLAFVDRIAFIGFVPRGFADPANMQLVLERHVAKSGGPRLDALLTLQDLDVLQAEVERVQVSQPVCELLAQLVASLHADINAAVRSDPSFVPTRYLSTRTVVRSGNVLRAACVYDRIFNTPERPLQVLPADLSRLRLHLLLGGPGADAIEALLGQESDPRERRQLEIVRSEREMFDRCLAALPEVELPPPPAVDDESSEPATEEQAAAAIAPAPTPPWPQVDEAVAAADVPRLMAVARELTDALSRDPDAPGAQFALDRTLAALHQQVVRAALDASGSSSVPLLDAISGILDLAGSVGNDARSLHPLARWLRGRALAMVDEAARHGPGSQAATLRAALEPNENEAASELANRRLDSLERFASLRAQALDQAHAAGGSDEAWREALEAAEDDLAALWDAAFCHAVERELGDRQTAALWEVLQAVEPELRWLDELATRLERIAGRTTPFKAKAIVARLDDLIASLMERIEVVDRATLHDEIERVLGLLDVAKLDGTVAPAQWLSWSADAINRSAKAAPTPSDDDDYDYAGYRALRSAEQRVPAGYTLAEVALRVAPEHADGAASDSTLVPSALATLLNKLSPEQRERAGRIDLDRIERAVAYLAGWWRQLCSGEAPVRKRLEAVVKSRLFEVIWDEEALSRFALEAQLVADLLPEHSAEATHLRQRIVELDRDTRRAARALLRSRTDEAWAAALKPADRSAD